MQSQNLSHIFGNVQIAHAIVYIAVIQITCHIYMRHIYMLHIFAKFGYMQCATYAYIYIYINYANDAAHIYKYCKSAVFFDTFSILFSAYFETFLPTYFGQNFRYKPVSTRLQTRTVYNLQNVRPDISIYNVTTKKRCKNQSGELRLVPRATTISSHCQLLRCKPKAATVQTKHTVHIPR